MGQAFPPQFKTRLAVVLFVKGATTPIVLYFENPLEEYKEFQNYIKTSGTSVKLIEKNTIGPIKKFSILSNQIAGVAIQEEQYQWYKIYKISHQTISITHCFSLGIFLFKNVKFV